MFHNSAKSSCALNEITFAQYQILDLDHESYKTSLPDGSRIITDDAGRVCQVEYSSGVVVRRHDEYVIVKSADLTTWFGTASGAWLRLD